MDKRYPLAEGTRIFDQTNRRTYCILESKGQGALCLAYRAFYTDNLDKKHTVILKELYPVKSGYLQNRRRRFSGHPCESDPCL